MGLQRQKAAMVRAPRAESFSMREGNRGCAVKR